MSHKKTVELSRRAVLSAASLSILGVVANKAFPQTPQASGQSLPENDLDSWPADTQGLLARTRLNPDVVALMTKATRFSAQGCTAAVSAAVSAKDRRLTSRFHSAWPFPSAPESDEAQMARRLAGLILRDELWTEARIEYPIYSMQEAARFDFNFADTYPGVTLSVCPAAHVMQLGYPIAERSTYLRNTLLFDPVGREMIAFIKAVFPGNAAVQSLVFTPETPKPPRYPGITSRPPDVPTAIWNKICLLKPGMTRADLLEIFEAEGGWGGSFILPHRLDQGHGIDVLSEFARLNLPAPKVRATGPNLKIRAEFAPADCRILWRSGKGFLRNPEDASRIGTRELPTDIITSLWPLYRGYMVMD